MNGFPKDTTLYDVYCTACPKCHAIQGGNDWPPRLKEKFKCEYCGHEYTTEDLMEDEYGCSHGENGLPLTKCSFYTLSRVEEWD